MQTGKRPVSDALDDPLDRALKYRETELSRKHLDELGMLKMNRGGQGISGFHTHEVCGCCLLVR